MEDSAHCVFCQVIAGKKPCFKVYEDDLVLAIMDIYPATEGHVLVMPKEHVPDIFSISDAAMRATFGTAREIGRAIQGTVDPDGLTMVQANGSAAGQTVTHFHVHLIPREQGRKLRMHGPIQGNPERLAEVARMFADAL